jgi:L-aspartate oxidase
MESTDILVIGSGIAGLGFALKAAEFAKVVLVTKDKILESNTRYAQGGLAAVFEERDSYKLHIKDTLRAGDGLCNKKAVKFLVGNAPKEILWLKEMGVKFDKELSKEAVHSRARIVHSGDITGERIEEVLVDRVKKNKRIRVLEYNLAISLLVKNKQCHGAVVLDIKPNKIIRIISKATVLATGGLGRAYKNTCNPEIATGDGFALAYNAGACLEDMEFVQFHPTGLFGSKPAFLISETLRGEGGHLRNKFGEIYMPKYHRDGELAPRDVVSKFSVDEMKRTKADHVVLDLTHKDPEYLKKRFPKIYKKCLEYGIDLTKKPIPVAPTAHYSCGGVKIDLEGRTNVDGLYAIGEVSCSGLHGADRLASNSLTEGLVFGKSLCNYLKDKIKINTKNINNLINKKIIIGKEINKNKINNEKNNKKNELNKLKHMKKQLQNLMWDDVGIIRTEKGLKRALKKINQIDKTISKLEGRVSKEVIELRNMADVSRIITVSALKRKESRGTHFIEEYPKRDDGYWGRHLTIQKG